MIFDNTLDGDSNIPPALKCEIPPPKTSKPSSTSVLRIITSSNPTEEGNEFVDYGRGEFASAQDLEDGLLNLVNGNVVWKDKISKMMAALRMRTMVACNHALTNKGGDEIEALVLVKQHLDLFKSDSELNTNNTKADFAEADAEGSAMGSERIEQSQQDTVMQGRESPSKGSKNMKDKQKTGIGLPSILSAIRKEGKLPFE